MLEKTGKRDEDSKQRCVKLLILPTLVQSLIVKLTLHLVYIDHCTDFLMVPFPKISSRVRSITKHLCPRAEPISSVAIHKAVHTMPFSPRAFVRGITQSSRAHRTHASRCSPSTRIYPSEATSQTWRPLHNLKTQRCLSSSSRAQQVQSATVPRPNTTSNPPSATPAKPTSPPQLGSANLKAGLSDQPKKLAEETSSQIDWTTSFHGLSDAPFSKEAANVLLKPLDPNDVEIKPDGIIYLPEIKYRRILNLAFGPGGWGLAPRGESTVTAKAVTREYALLVHGRYVGNCAIFCGPRN